ncbi:class I SAM-dependent rRNA methyltransferase [Cysteiniphilum sp. JM-1]|uniref:class I SAM-dependent rRNA methyltransferase n=1 Tax=Cysteiniphilum sp. JM-1 TaxID=2610891 RepID=UPI0012483C09|nr:class I SAM-dependent methyltransferase [Cysteiniphilum sp. JM-1]
MNIPTISLNSKIKNFHTRQIFYSNEVNHLTPELLNPHGAALVEQQGRLALYSKHQLAAIRMTRINMESINNHDIEYALRQFLAQLQHDKQQLYFVQQGEAFRLCHGDHDGLPGITIDCYNSATVVQSSSAASDLLMPYVIQALIALMPDTAIFERSTGQIREIEKLGSITQWQYLSGESTQTTLFAGKRIMFDLINGQKTGLFLDQRLNLIALRNYLHKGMTSMLDICSYMGAWSVAAADFIDHFTLIDQSKAALAMAKTNIEQNHQNTSSRDIELEHGDMFETLKKLKAEQQYFDVVVADPPAFAKSKKHIPEAKRAYQRLFKLALSCLNKGGLFIACSCSRHIDEATFFEILQSLSYDLVLLHKGYSSPCHTQSIHVDYHDYLKCYIFKLR